MDSVELIASGYEWVCPKCDCVNDEIEITEEVECDMCGFKFTVSEIHHAHG